MVRDRHGSRAPAPHRNRGHRSRSVAAFARRGAGAFLFSLFALLIVAPAAQAHDVSAPTSVTLTATDNSITVSWSGATGSVSRHFVYWKANNSQNFLSTATKSAQLLSTASSYEIMGLNAGTTYYVAVDACSLSPTVHCATSTIVSKATLVPAAATLATPTTPPATTLSEASFPGDGSLWPSLAITLTGATFGGGLNKGQFTLVTNPSASGLSVQSISRIDSTRAFITINPTGFSIAQDIQLTVRIAAAATSHSADITTSAFTITNVPLNVPGNVRASALNDNNHGTDRLEWDAVTGSSGITYDVQRRRTGQTAWQTAVEVTTGTSYDFAKESGTSGSAYDYRVRAKTSAEQSAWSSPVTVAGRPGGIDNLSATASPTDVVVILSWTAPSTGGKPLTGYRVEWREDATGDWSSNPAQGSTTAPGDVLGFTVNAGHGLQPGTVYDFRIRADNPDRSSFFSNTAQANQATPAANPPGAPTNLRVTSTSNQNLDVLAWNAPSSTGGAAITGYQLQRRATNVATWETALDLGAVTSHNYNKAAWRLGYVYRVRAQNSAGYGDWSNELTVGGRPAFASAPSVSVSVTMATLTWNALSGLTTGPTDSDGGSPIIRYSYRWKLSSAAAWSTRAASPPTATTAEITGLEPETSYDFDVIACNKDRCSFTSADATATTLPDDARIAATDPSPLTEANLNGGKVTVEFVGRPHRAWEPNLLVSQFTASGVPGVSVSAVERLSDRQARLTLAYDDTDFDDDRTLQIRIAGIAYNYGGHITAATRVQAVVEAPPAQVENVRLTPGTQRVKVKWDGVPTAYENLDRNRYRVQWKGPGGGWRELRRARGSLTSYTIPGLNPGTEYAVRVIATRHKAPDGPPSAEARATTPAFGYRIAGTEPAELTGANLHGASITVALQGAEWNAVGGPGMHGQRHRFGVSFSLSGVDTALDTGVWVERVENVSPSELRVVLGHRGPAITEDGNLTLTIYADRHTWNKDITVTAPVRAPGQAGGLHVTEITDSTVTLVWDRVEGNDVWYRVRWQESGSDGGWRARWTLGPDAPGRNPFYQIRGLTPDTDYTVQVRSWDRGGAGWGRWSSATMTTTGGEFETSPQQRAGVTVAAADPLTVDEGGSATYTVVLNGEPTGDVTIAVTSDNADVTAAPASLTFTAGNWQTAQMVTVSAAQDGDAADEAATLGHAASGAGEYAGIAVASVAVAVTDDDGAGVTVSETSLTLEEGGTATYTVVLDTRPSAFVSIYPVVHGGGLTAAPSEFTFTPENWQTAQTVTVSAAQDDDAEDGEGAITHATAIAAVEYVGVIVPDVTVSVTDDDAQAETAEQQPPWTLELVRDDQPFTTVAETDADAAYPSTFLRLVRGSSTAPLPETLAVAVGGTAANPADYAFNHGNAFASLARKSADLMRGARKITVKGDDVDEGAETIAFSVTIEGETLRG